METACVPMAILVTTASRVSVPMSFAKMEDIVKMGDAIACQGIVAQGVKPSIPVSISPVKMEGFVEVEAVTVPMDLQDLPVRQP